MQPNKVWKGIERFKILLELIIALFIVSPVVFVILRQGLAAVVPLWLTVLITAFAVLLGYLLGRRPRTFKVANKLIRRGRPLQSIRFNYSDSPANHGWKISDTSDDAEPIFSQELDGFYGRILKIRPAGSYAMDIDVSPPAQIGRALEIVTKLGNNYAIYALASVQSKDGSKNRNVYFSFRVGNGEPLSLNESEWEIFVSPEQAEGEWSVLRIDLDDALESSVGKMGWKFRKLRGMRLRGKLDLAFIDIY